MFEYSGFSFLVALYQCSIRILILMEMLSEGQAGGVWEVLNKASSCRRRGVLERKVIYRILLWNFRKFSVIQDVPPFV